MSAIRGCPLDRAADRCLLLGPGIDAIPDAIHERVCVSDENGKRTQVHLRMPHLGRNMVARA